MERARAVVRALAAVAALAAACASPPALAWKSVTFADAARADLFAACREVVLSHYGGVAIRVDEAAGQIATDPIEETIGGKVLRQQCYVAIAERDGTLEVALLAPISRREFDPAGDPPVRWIELGSDEVVEGQLLDEICGRVLARDVDARVVAADLPRPAAGR